MATEDDVENFLQNISQKDILNEAKKLMEARGLEKIEDIDIFFEWGKIYNRLIEKEKDKQRRIQVIKEEEIRRNNLLKQQEQERKKQNKKKHKKKEKYRQTKFIGNRETQVSLTDDKEMTSFSNELNNKAEEQIKLSDELQQKLNAFKKKYKIDTMDIKKLQDGKISIDAMESFVKNFSQEEKKQILETETQKMMKNEEKQEKQAKPIFVGLSNNNIKENIKNNTQTHKTRIEKKVRNIDNKSF